MKTLWLRIKKGDNVLQGSGEHDIHEIYEYWKKYQYIYDEYLKALKAYEAALQAMSGEIVLPLTSDTAGTFVLTDYESVSAAEFVIKG